MFIKNPYKEVLVEIEDGLWEHDCRVDDGIAMPYMYDDETFRACIKIMMSGLMYKLYDNSWGLTQDFKEREADICGGEFKDFIYKYTGIDSTKLYDEIENKTDKENV